MNKSKKPTKDSRVISYSPLLTVLFVALFIIIPMSVVWILVAPEFGNVKITKTLWIILSPVLILTLSIVINIVFVLTNLLNIRSFNFSIPFGIIFSLIIWLCLAQMPFWIKYIIAPVVGILVAIVTNIAVGKIEDKILNKNKQNSKI
ncbi:MAG3450 family membrane protein [Mycoplasmopsis agalactiae]|uniref:Uncharacterized protein n=1 Tax=Mycoplasmopsis agalactiae TaxID=2110 RepID=D3VQJ9_MYCAA|nr:hypothetical protein [Mycoplasmopsis agalactiae]KAB6718304.1 hypothetical protein E4L58_03545 [Mycoplasmopsis agalactiae]CBH40594.1 Hypothetical protein MAGa3810 [Mycoplasmopsis agalactiae]